MNISKNSWHYRMNEYLSDRTIVRYVYHVDNICQYFWKTIYCFFRIPVFWILSIFYFQIPKTGNLFIFPREAKYRIQSVGVLELLFDIVFIGAMIGVCAAVFGTLLILAPLAILYFCLQYGFGIFFELINLDPVMQFSAIFLISLAVVILILAVFSTCLKFAEYLQDKAARCPDYHRPVKPSKICPKIKFY